MTSVLSLYGSNSRRKTSITRLAFAFSASWIDTGDIQIMKELPFDAHAQFYITNDVDH